MARKTDADIAYADMKIAQAYDAVSDQITLIFRMKSRQIDLSDGEERLDALNRELRQWREYRELLLVRKGMLSPDKPSN